MKSQLRSGRRILLAMSLIILSLLFTLAVIAPPPAMAASTTLTITKLASDGTTVLDQKIVTWQELAAGVLNDETTIPIMGDGVTHYYHQGPIFIDDPDPVVQEALRWNPEEDFNWYGKDYGALRGTNVKDLCDLVGGMTAGEEVKVLSSDGFYKMYAYKNVYEYPDRTGPMVVTWEKNGMTPENGYNEGMRLVWFAEATWHDATDTSMGSPNPADTYHVFGNYDWHESADKKYWYYYSGQYPTTTGLSGQMCSQIIIYSDDPAPLTPPSLTADGSDNTVGQAVDIAFTDDASWRGAVTDVTVDGASIAGQYTLTAGNINIPADVFTTAGNYAIIVKATGFTDATVTQTMAPAPAAPVAAFTADTTSGTEPLTVNFTDASTGTTPLTYAWDFNNDSIVDSTVQNPSHQYSAAGTYSVKLTVTNSVSSDEEIKTDYITVSPAPVAPVAAFTAAPLSGTAPLTVNFTDASTGTGPLTYAWDFNNDGTVDSTLQNPTYIYSTPGTYSVKLTVNNGVDSDEELKADYITVNAAPVAPVAAFSAAPTTGTAPLTVIFTDASTGTGPLTYAWDFNNDGTVDSTLQNPTYIYSTPGTYSVKLTVNNGVDSDEELKTDYITVGEPSAMDVLYDGTVNLTPGETFDKTAYNSSVVYTAISKTTPLGALQEAAEASGFTYDVTDKNFATSGTLLLDNVDTYLRDKTNGIYWYAYVNDVYKDGYNNPAGALNLIELVNGDKVEFYYAAGISDPTDLDAVKAAATAAVKTVASTGVTPADWTLQLSGAKEQSVTKSYFENGLACSSSSHQVFWTDDYGDVWGGVPLWLLVGMVDDNPDVGPDHFNFNDDLAAQNYEINVFAGDGFKATLQSAEIARDNGFIVANTLNGGPLPIQTDSGKPCWPLHLKGPAVLSGDQVGNIARIELTGLPQPQEGWTLELLGDVGDTITQKEFEDGLACTGSGHYREWTDIDGNTWSGVPLWVLLGTVDDLESSSHWTFNDDRAAAGYTVKVIAGDGFTKEFAGADLARSDDFIIANKLNGAPLTDSIWPLRLVGNGVIKTDGSGALGGRAVGNIVKIEIPALQTLPPAEGSWNLALNGKISDVISQAEMEAGIACPQSGHYVEWTDNESNVWSGIPLWFLTGWIDDREPHAYDANQAMAGYTVLVKAGDGYTREFASTDIAWSSDYIIANKINGAPLDGTSWPLRLVGAGVATAEGSLSGTSVRNVAEIELTGFQAALPIPEVHVVKYAEDRISVVDEMTVDYMWMLQSNLAVIGDGTTVYRYEGITNNPDDVWDEAETYPGGYKIENAVKGTRVKDLCDLVGGMGAGTEIVFVASDGFETTLPYSSIYTDPAVQERQGDAILAWWGDGEYVPYYADGMRLFFTPGGDNVYGQWDMHETLSSNYWHYYYSGNVQYPSCAGLSAKYITEIKIYSAPVGDWTLELDGQDIGGLQYDVSKTYFEQALACQFGAEHKAAYTDSEDQVWEGMPLWFLAGFVDDADQHSDNSFNDELALAGYNVVITAADGYSVTIASADIIRNSDYIVANTLNGALIPETDSSWPLRLVGPAVEEATSISQIVRIELVRIPAPGAPAAAFSAAPTTGTAPLTVNFTDASTGTGPLTYAWDFDNDGTADSTDQNPSYEYTVEGVYTVKLTVTNIAGSDDEVKTDYITVSAPLPLTSPELIADTTDNMIGRAIDITFADNAAWRAAITDVTVGGTTIDGQYTMTTGNLNIASGVFSAAGDYEIVVAADGYEDAAVTQTMAEELQLLIPPVLMPDTTNNTVSKSVYKETGRTIDIKFADNKLWRAAVTSVLVNDTELNSDQYSVSKGKLRIIANFFSTAGDYEIIVRAGGYEDSAVLQTMLDRKQKTNK